MEASCEILREVSPPGEPLGLQLSPVDLKHLGRYTLGNKALEREILDLFFQQLPSSISALTAASNDKEWHVAAHTLKGSGRAVGAWRIARLAEQAERAPAYQNRARVAETIELIQNAADEARNFVASVYR
jgi:HPt (histidine-containing phosphotransfer) domain-containing protein